MADTENLSDELRPEYDESFLRAGVRGKYAERYASGSNVVRLAPDVAKSFPNEASVNEALRLVLRFKEDASRLTQSALNASGSEEVG